MINIVSKRYWFFALSLLVILPGMIALALWGLPVGIDFSGGSLLDLRFPRHLQGDRARSWRRNLGGIIGRSGEHVHLHPAGGPVGGLHGKEGDSRCG